MSHDAFISYASEDLPSASAIRDYLAAEGLRCWMAPFDITPGQSFAVAISEALEASRTVVLVLSAHANASEHVPREIERAVHFGTPVIPFRLQSVLPARTLEHFISSVHWLDGSKPPRKEELVQLAGAVRQWVANGKPTGGSSHGMPALVAETAPKRIALLYKRHAKQDEAILKFLETEFGRLGHSVFVDRNIGIGVEWAKELDRRIRESDAVIPLISAQSVKSEMLASELQIAQDEVRRRGKPRILPVRVDFEGDLPSDMAGVLQQLQYFLWKNPQDNSRLLRELKDALETPELPAPRGAPPTGVLPLDSRWYVERSADAVMRSAIQRRDSVIRIRGARQVGKTSLLARGLDKARTTNTRVVFTDFQQLNASDLSSVEALFRTLAEWIADELEIQIPADRFLTGGRNPSKRFDQFICREVLGRIDGPLVWAMDEVDRLFHCPFRSEVFGLFRSWHNARATEPRQPWGRLSLVIAYATEAHLLIENLDQSPFNVGTSLTLEDFDATQLAELNGRYGEPLRDAAEREAYHGLVGGHPFLANRGLHEMTEKGWDVATFAAQAEREEGVFTDHLRRLLLLLSKDAALTEAVRTVIRGRPVESNETFLRLRSAGVLAGDSMEEARMRCRLYAAYLKRHLK